jgi:transposase
MGTRVASRPRPRDAGNRRLHDRWTTFNLRRKRHVIANVALARELAGRCWSLAVMQQQ